MKYLHVARYVASTLWAIEQSKMADILDVLAFRAAGYEFTPEEIKARIGDGGDGASSPTKRGGIAIIPVQGTIAHRGGGMADSSGGTSCERIGAMLDQVASDASIGTVIFDFDSPGGTVPGVAELASKMYETKGRGAQRYVAQINGMACSAAYWLASQCDEIVSIPSGTAGSIGVYTAHQDLSKALENEGINVTLISAGKFKVEGNPFEPLSEDAKAVIQARVDEAYSAFVKDVARGRGVSPADVRDGYGEGRTLGAKDALKAGLIDSIGTMDATISRIVGKTSRAGMRADADVDLAAVEMDSSDADRARRLRLL